VLRREYDSEAGSFLHLGRIERTWDRGAVNRLQRTMREVCEGLEGQDRIDRWISDAFWYAACKTSGTVSGSMRFGRR